MDIGFFYNHEPGEPKDTLRLYYKKDEFDALAGLVYKEELDDAEVDHRVHIALSQCLNKLYAEIINLPPTDKVDVDIVFYQDKEELPETVGRRIQLRGAT